MDSNGSNGLAVLLAHRASLRLARRRRLHHPRPPGITVAGPTVDREWEYERALHESQTAAAWPRDGALRESLGSGATSTMLRQSADGIGAPVWDGAECRVALSDSGGSVALAIPVTPQQQHLSLSSSSASSSAKKVAQVPIPCRSGELVADSDVRSAGQVECRWREDAFAC